MSPLNTTKLVIAAVAAALLTACGGSSTPVVVAPASSITAYQAGLSIGDSGELIIDSEKLTYQLTIQKSSYGLIGKVLSGFITKNSDGSYHIVGTTNGTIFDYGNYAVLTLKIDRTDIDYASFYAAHPLIPSSFYVPIFSIKADKLLKTVDGITSGNVSLEYRGINYGFATSNNVQTYLSRALRGIIKKINDTSFSVDFCSNQGQTIKNTRLITANCVAPFVATVTYTYDSASSSWLVTPVDAAHPSQVIHAYFVNDVVTNQVVGFVDTSDTTKTSARFGISSIVPVDTPLINIQATSMSLTSYQICTSSSSCGGSDESGIYKTSNAALSYSGVTIKNKGNNCNQTTTSDSPVNGFLDTVYDSSCGVGNRPEALMFTFGQRVVNGKSTMLSVFAGYDPTLPGQSDKLGFNIISEN